jgi:hypothetical protein
MDGGDFFGKQGLLPVMTTLTWSNKAHHSYYVYHLDPTGSAWRHPTMLPFHMGPPAPSKADSAPVNPIVDIARPKAWYFEYGNRLAFTLNGGRSWTYRQLHLRPGFQVVGIRFFGGLHGYVWASLTPAWTSKTQGPPSPRSIMDSTSDGGKTWQTVKLPGGR